jgi:hypothetical protein
MSNTPFIESQSDDPTEQAVARKVHRILNDKTLDRQQRENLVRRAQRDLIEHRRQREQQQKLVQQVSRLPLPKGFRAQSIQVRGGQVQVGALNHRNSFVWLEAGEAPTGWRPTAQRSCCPGSPKPVASRPAKTGSLSAARRLRPERPE